MSKLFTTLKSTPVIIVFFFLISLFTFYKFFLGQVPTQGDLLAGAYMPWLDYKWGYSVGVPIENPSLSDVISAQYPWRELAINLIKEGSWPLWNPYSFSGTPLLANLQSAPFYILNIWMVIFPILTGWTFLLWSQIFFSLVFMYLYLKEINLGITASLAGSLSFAFSGFMVTYLQMATIGQTFIWLPLLMLFTEKYLKQNFIFWLVPIPLISFFIITAGNFQTAFYAFSIWFLYLSLKIVLNTPKKNIKNYFLTKITLFSVVLIAMFTLSAVQILPSVELFGHSIRNLDPNIKEYNFGLIPWKNLFTLISPDFFGNPVTGNFWGVIGYQETSGYFGIVAFIFFIIGAAYGFKKRKHELILFFLLFAISLILIIDSPISRFFYLIKVPILSTSYATRMFVITDFAGVVLAAVGVNEAIKDKSNFSRIVLFVLGAIIGTEVGLFVCIKIITTHNFGQINAVELKNYFIAFKNTLLPLALTVFLLIISLFKDKYKNLSLILITTLILFDSLRFGMKFNTFSKAQLTYPQTPITKFLQNNIGYFRFDREHAEIMPPNSWIHYKIMSPSGYDPLYSLNYSQFYNLYNDYRPNSQFSRYAELLNYNSPFLDLAGVKYIATIKRNSKGLYSSTEYYYPQALKIPKFEKAFEDRSVLILKNKDVMPRVSLFDNYVVENNHLEALNMLYRGFNFKGKIIINDSPTTNNLKLNTNDKAVITRYLPNQVDIQTHTKSNTVLMLTDSYYPGWKVTIDNIPDKILEADGVYRAVLLPSGNHIVSFIYDPLSFKLGLYFSIITFLGLLPLFLYSKKKKICF